MKLSIFRKLIGSFMILALLVVLAGATGMLMVNKVAGSGNAVVEEQVPLKDVAVAAVVAAQQALSTCRQYLHAKTGLAEIEDKIKAYMDDFDMFIAMIEHGADSEEFKNSSAGKMYVHT